MNNSDFVFGYFFNLIIFWGFTYFIYSFTKGSLYGFSGVMFLASLLIAINLLMNRKNNIVVFWVLWFVYFLGSTMIFHLFQLLEVSNFIYRNIELGTNSLARIINGMLSLSLVAFVVLSGVQTYKVAKKDKCNRKTWVSTIVVGSIVSFFMQFLHILGCLVSRY